MKESQINLRFSIHPGSAADAQREAIERAETFYGRTIEPDDLTVTCRATMLMSGEIIGYECDVRVSPKEGPEDS